MIGSKIEQQRNRALQMCRERGITVSKFGNGWWLNGYGVDIKTADLAYIDGKELTPDWMEMKTRSMKVPNEH